MAEQGSNNLPKSILGQVEALIEKRTTKCLQVKGTGEVE